MLHVSTTNRHQGKGNSSFPRMRNWSTYLRIRNWYLVHHPHTILTHEINIQLHFTALKTKWNSERLTGSLVLLLLILNAKFSYFHLKTQKNAFLISRKIQFGRYCPLSTFQFPPANRSNQVKMTDACKRSVAHPAHVFPWVHELIFSTVKCHDLRSESAEDVMTLAQHQQYRYGNYVCNTLPFTYVHCWFRYHIYLLNERSGIL